MLEYPSSHAPFLQAAFSLFWGGREHHGFKSSPDKLNVQPKFGTAALKTVVFLNRMTPEQE